MFLFNVALQPQLRSKVLLTTRLCPRVLEARGGGLLAGCREEPLLQMQPDDAVAFFQAQGIRGTHTEIEAACAPYGYHPLSLRLLAGLIVGDFQQPGDIAAARRLDVSGDLVQRQHHVLQTAYDSLAPSPQALLGRIACFRSPVGYETLKAIAVSGNARERPVRGRARLPDRRLTPCRSLGRILIPICATWSRGGWCTTTRRGPVRPAPHRPPLRLRPAGRAGPGRRPHHLRDYFAAVPAPDKVTRLEDLAPVIELYHHTVRAGQLDKACTLFRDRFTTRSTTNSAPTS